MPGEISSGRDKRFTCPWPVIVLCSQYGFLLSVHFSVLSMVPLYISEDLQFEPWVAVFLIHFKTGARLLVAVIAAFLADFYFGKFIIMASSYLCISTIPIPLRILSTFYVFGLEKRKIIYLTCIVVDIIFGYGAVIHPAFIAEQFIMPDQELALQTYYTCDYFYTHALTSLLRVGIVRAVNETSCFGGPKCYQILFGLYFFIYLCCTVVFVSLKKWYRIIKPDRKTISENLHCIRLAMKRKKKNKSKTVKECMGNWKEDFLRVAKVFVVMIPYFIYAFLYSQLTSVWIYQASRLNGYMNDYWVMTPPEIEAVSPMSALMLAPLIIFVLEPCCRKNKFMRTPLQKIGLAYTLSILAFIAALVLETFIDNYQDPVFETGKAQIRVINCLNEEVEVRTDWLTETVKPKGSMNIFIDGYNRMNSNIDIKTERKKWLDVVKVQEEEGSNYVITEDGLKELKDKFNKSSLVTSRSTVLVLCCGKCKGTFYINFPNLDYKSDTLNLNGIKSSVLTLMKLGRAQFIVGEKTIAEQEIQDGGLYNIVISGSSETNEDQEGQVNTLLKEKSLTMLWMIPQFVIITIADILLYTSVNLFVYTQSPTSMRSVMRGLFHGGIAITQMIFGIMALAKMRLFVWYGTMIGVETVAIILHLIFSHFYKSVVPDS